MLDEVPRYHILNHPDDVHNAKNKLTCFQTLEQFGMFEELIPWTQDQGQVEAWLQDGHTVFARTTLTGHSGAGIIELSGADTVIPPAPLYTKYIKKKAEFRVHIFNNDQHQCLITQKVARPGAEVTNWRVRSHQNGFIFQEPAANLPANLTNRLQALAIEVTEFLGLDFGAVDIIWNEHEDHLYFLEVNTAPGITGRTVDFYRNAFESI